MEDMWRNPAPVHQFIVSRLAHAFVGLSTILLVVQDQPSTVVPPAGQINGSLGERMVNHNGLLVAVRLPRGTTTVDVLVISSSACVLPIHISCILFCCNLMWKNYRQPYQRWFCRITHHTKLRVSQKGVPNSNVRLYVYISIHPMYCNYYVDVSTIPKKSFA